MHHLFYRLGARYWVASGRCTCDLIRDKTDSQNAAATCDLRVSFLALFLWPTLGLGWERGDKNKAFEYCEFRFDG